MPLRVAIIGLGAVGSALAYHLSDRGVAVTGFDRFEPPHDRGSSHGESRITRTATAEGPEYAPIARRSHEIWRELERRTNETIFTPCGILLLGTPGNQSFDSARRVAREAGLECVELNSEETRARFPQFEVPDDIEAVFQRDGGLVRPELAIRTQLSLARESGAEIVANAPVERVEHHAKGVTVIAGGRTIEVDTAVISAGAWVRDFLPESHRPRVTLHREPLFWFELTHGAPSYDPSVMPAFIWYGERGLYGFPSLDGGRSVKVAWEQRGTLLDPNSHSTEVRSEETEAFHRDYVAGKLVGLTPKTTAARACIYTVLAEKRFLIDSLPDRPNTWIVSACSGHGFKHSTAIGEAIADRITGKDTRFDLSAFAWKRWAAATPMT